MSEHQTQDDGQGGTALDYHDTIGLLQEEIARLEAALANRDEADAGNTARAEVPPDRSEVEGLERRLDDFTNEIASRDETISLLLEQVRLFEEAEAAGRAEFEQ